jgi:hypothetical protein
MSKQKKKFNETRVGKFLKEKAPDLAGDLLGLVGDVTGVGVLSNIGDKIKGSTELSPEDKALALKELDLDIVEMQEVSKRWEADMKSDSFLSKNARPLTLLWLMLIMSILIFVDSVESISFTVEEAWISLLSTLLVTVVVAYFGSRGYEKGKKLK